jgi:hypothetical protein
MVMCRKKLILIFILFSVIQLVYGEENNRKIHIGIPKESFELQGPVKRVTYISQVWKSEEEEEWETRRGFTSPYSVRFNRDGYVTFWEDVQLIGDGIKPIAGAKREYNSNGEPAYIEKYNRVENTSFRIPYEMIMVEGKTWYTYTKKKEEEEGSNTWIAWKEEVNEEEITVKRIYVSSTTQEGAIEDIRNEKTHRSIYEFVYRPNGTVKKIDLPGSRNIYFDEQGNFVKSIVDEPNGQYIQISETEAEYRYDDIDRYGTGIRHYTFELDEYGNWTEKMRHAHFTKAPDENFQKTVRKIAYYTEGTQKRGVLNDSEVRVRGKPNLEGTPTGALQKGQHVVILDETEDKMQIGDMEAKWYKIETEEGLIGWSYGYFIDVK